MSIGRKTGFLITMLVFVTAGLGFYYRQDIYDWAKLRNYSPPPEIVSLADNTTMNDKTRRLFFVNRPTITDKDSFNQHCRDVAHQHSIVLGCYLPGQRGIYLLDVTDERLQGIKEVTAAHELLHAAYERLSIAEKNRIDSLLQEAYKNITSDRIKETIEQYRKQDPLVVNNELHSIIGTEVRSLSRELENHYARYFNDRLKIVAYSEKYEQAFVERRNLIRDYDFQLASLREEIEELSGRLESENASIQESKQNMSDLERQGRIDEFNALVPEHNMRVEQYNNQTRELTSLIVEHNRIVQQRNAIASEQAELVDAIDSRTVVPDQH